MPGPVRCLNQIEISHIDLRYQSNYYSMVSPTPLIPKLIELAYNEAGPDLTEHEIEERLLDYLLGKELKFSTEKNDSAIIRFHSLGRSTDGGTVVTLEVEGIEFEQEAERLTLDLRYIYYKQYGHQFCFGNPTKFLTSSPFVQSFSPQRILIEFAVYGETVHHVNRSLPIFADIIKLHQGERHQTAIDWHENQKDELDNESGVNLEEPIQSSKSADEPIEYLYARSDDESYIEEYINYIDNPRGNIRNIIDNRNTFADSK